MSAGPRIVPLAQSLGHAAGELAEMEALSTALQATIAKLVAALPGASHELLVEAQAADALTQRLGGLARFVGYLAEATPVELAADVAPAIAALTLSDQALRLGAGAGPAAADHGELVLFED